MKKARKNLYNILLSLNPEKTIKYIDSENMDNNMREYIEYKETSNIVGKISSPDVSICIII